MPYLRVEKSDAHRRCSQCKKRIVRGTRHLVSSYKWSTFPHYRRNYCKTCVFHAIIGFFAPRVAYGWKRGPLSRCACGRAKARWRVMCTKCERDREVA